MVAGGIESDLFYGKISFRRDTIHDSHPEQWYEDGREGRRSSFSIVIPTYDRPREIKGCLESIRRLDYPPERFEVLVVDDGSPIRLDEVVEPLRIGIDLKLIRQDNRGPAAARNTGVAHAQGKFVAFTDDDCRVDASWLTALEAQIRGRPDCIVGGQVVNALWHNMYAVTSQVILDAVYTFYNSSSNTARFFASNNFAVLTETFRGLGGFDTTFPRAAAEDRDLCDRWRHAGYPLVCAPDALVYHAHDMNLRGYCRQHFNYGRGAWQYHLRRAARGSGRLHDDVRFHAQCPKIFRSLLKEYSARQRAEIVALLGIWQICNAAGFFFEKIATHRSSRP